MRSGTLRDRVTIQRLAAADDPGWGVAGTWNDLVDVWASVTPQASTEAGQPTGVVSEVTYDIALRFRTDLTDQDRLVYRGRTLDILSLIDPDGRRRQLRVVAKEHPQAAAPGPTEDTDG